MAETNKKSGSFRLITTFLRGSVSCFVITILANMIVTVLDGFIPQILRYSVDTLIGGKAPALPKPLLEFIEQIGGASYLSGRFYIIAAAVAVTALFSGVFRFLNRYYMSMGSERFTENARNLLFRKINMLPFSWHSANNTGDIIQRCTSDVDTVRNFVSEQLVGIFRIVFMAAYAVTMMYSMNAVVATFAVAFLPLIFTYSCIFHSKIGKRFREADESEGVLSTVTQENLTGMRVVKAFGMEEAERVKFEAANDNYTTLWAKLGGVTSLFWGTSDFVGCMQMLTVLTVCIIQAKGGAVTAGECIAFISYNVMLGWPIRQLGRMVSEMSKAGVSIERLNYIMDAEIEPDGGEESADWKGNIDFSHVSFGYDGKELLRDVSFSIEGGTTVGITGGTGSGKSTLAALLCRMFELDGANGGKISIGGSDIAGLKLSALRSNVSIILQEPFLFSRTIGENIALGAKNHDASLDEIRASASAACVDDAIEGFSHGYDTEVGERGVTLSGGQKQRVAIARTLLHNPPVIIFDDSLSAVDTETDAKIRAEIKKRRGSTIIIVSHRVTSLMGADKIVVLDEGRVAEEGTHEQLLALGGRYRAIYDIQQAGVKELTADKLT